MARGRNQNRNRNHIIQNSNSQKQQQQQQQSATLTNKSLLTKEQQPSIAPVASIINNHHHREHYPQHQNDSNICSIEQNNDSRDAAINQCNNYAINYLFNKEEVAASAALLSPIENNPHQPAAVNSSQATNTYQMTISNNSEENLKQLNVNENHYYEQDNDEEDDGDDEEEEREASVTSSSSSTTSTSSTASDNESNSAREIMKTANDNQKTAINDQAREGAIANNTVNNNSESAASHHSLVGHQADDQTSAQRFFNKNNAAIYININTYDKENENGLKINDNSSMGQKHTKTNEGAGARTSRDSSVESVKSNRFKRISATPSPRPCSSLNSTTILTTTTSTTNTTTTTTNRQLPKIIVNECSVDGKEQKDTFFDSCDEKNEQKIVKKIDNELKYNKPVKLEDVPEQQEDINDEDEEDGDSEEFLDVLLTEMDNVDKMPSASPNHLDHEFMNTHSNSRTPERSSMIMKSNTNDSDSGLGDSMAASINSCQNETCANNKCNTTTKLPQQYNLQEQQQQQQQKQQQQTQHYAYLPFVRDGNSTDCEETLMPCDEVLLDFTDTLNGDRDTTAERLVCLESISLPDVVVESTNLTAGGSNCTHNSGTAAVSSTQHQQQHSMSSPMDNECDIININSGASSNVGGNVHFIPIHIEGQRMPSQSASASAYDDNNNNNDDDDDNDDDNGIEITEDASELLQTHTEFIAEQLKQELAEQKTQFHVKLEDAQKNVQNLQNKINEMQRNIENLEQELSTKTWNVERLQGELNAAQKDDEYVRKKMKVAEDEKNALRQRYNQKEDEFKKKYEELNTQYEKLQEKYKETQNRANTLHNQLNEALNEVEKWRNEVIEIRNDLEEQVRILKNAVENSENERKICADKWQTEFEMLRTHNMEREESIMSDCEWQLRQMQRQCKEKIDKLEHERREAKDKVNELEEEVEERCREVDDLRMYQSQVNSLRGVVNEQENSIKCLVTQIDGLKTELAVTKDQLEEQLEEVEKIKIKCQQTLYDKERHMHYQIEEVRNDAAAFWETKLYGEMSRLKSELDSVYVEERREALDKLQMEHIEELRAITNRYTANEEELQAELTEVQERLDEKTEEFLRLREKSDSALLQIRMHLERADRDYQVAMCREEEKRETLENNLREEFQEEKREMDLKHEQRLQQIKENFNRELQSTTSDLSVKHEKQIESIKEKLQQEKEEALKELAEKHRKKLMSLEENRKELVNNHKRDLSELKSAYQAEKAALDKRDISNAQEIEQLHRKCRCLTNLFEEMRMRYERRDPRPEDLREIAELRTRCETQERDLYLLTDRLREMQIQMNEMQHNGSDASTNNNKNHKKMKQFKKPPPKTIPTNCDVIYEENEERDNSPNTSDSSSPTMQSPADNNEKSNSYEVENKKLMLNMNEDDSHMITAM